MASNGNPILRASGLRKTFETGDSTVLVLKSVDISIREGEFVAIEGRSGSGKSTLLHILAGLDAADSGSVELDGRDINALAISSDRFLKTLRRRTMALPGSGTLLDLLW